MRKPATFLPALALRAAGAILGAAPSLAVPITYTETATATGSLNGVSFTNATVTLKMNNDTSAITGSAPVFDILGSATVSVSSVNGGAAVAFTHTIDVFSAQNAALGTGTVGFNDTGF